MNSMAVTHDDRYIRLSAFFKIPLLAKGLPRLLTMRLTGVVNGNSLVETLDWLAYSTRRYIVC